MNKGVKKALVLALAVTFAVSALAGCGKSAEQSKNDVSGGSGTVAAQPAEKKKVKFYYASQDRKANAAGDEEVKKYLNDKFNVDYQRIDIPEGQVPEKLSVMLAAGEQLDCFNAPLSGIQPYALTSLISSKSIQPLDDYLKKAGTNLLKEVPQEAWMYTKGEDGKTWAIPEMGFKSKVFLFVRQDWMEKLNIAVPKTIEEFEKMLFAFRDKDPDGNGKNDTYPLVDFKTYLDNGFMTSFIPSGTGWFEDKDGDLKPAFMHPSYKQYMATIQKWYKEKLIHPDYLLLKREQAKDIIVRGVSGVYPTWYTLHYEEDIKKVNPNAKVTFIPFPTGPSGKSGGMSDGLVRSAFVVMANTKPEVAERIMEIMDWFQTPQGTEFQNYGIEGKHYVKNGDVISTPQGVDPKTPLYKGQLIINGGNPWKYFKETALTSPMESATRQTSIKGNYPSNDAVDYMFVYDWSKSKSKDLLSDLDSKMPGEMYARVVSGEKPVEYIDEFIKEWLSKGGETYIKEKTEQYKAQKAKYGKR